MAGGTGTRLWPLSRRRRPKQAHALTGERTMFQSSVDRLLPLFGGERLLVATGVDQVGVLRGQVDVIPVENYVVEPLGKGTAPCIGLAAMHILKRDPGAVMVVVTADHYIEKVERFREILRVAMEVTDEGHLVTLGISPTHPSTAYGYIEQGERLDHPGDFRVFKVRRFTEKPDEETAKEMLERGGYSWNGGMFVWRVDRIMEEFESQMPKLHEQLMKIGEIIGEPDYEDNLRDVWSLVEKETIDYGVMEGAEDVVVIPSEIGWSDIGSWSSLASLLPSNENGNVSVGDCITIDTRGSLIFGGERLITTIGLEDVIIVDTDDALLVCTKASDQKVREIVDRLRESKSEELL